MQTRTEFKAITEIRAFVVRVLINPICFHSFWLINSHLRVLNDFPLNSDYRTNSFERTNYFWICIVCEKILFVVTPVPIPIHSPYLDEIKDKAPNSVRFECVHGKTLRSFADRSEGKCAVSSKIEVLLNLAQLRIASMRA